MGPRTALNGCGKSRPPTGIRSPDRPALSESLHNLSYPGPSVTDTELVESAVVFLLLTEDLVTISDKLRLSSDGLDAPLGIIFKHLTVKRLAVLR